MLHCLELVSGSEDLDGYAQNVSLEQLQDHCAEIVQCFVDSNWVDCLWTARSAEMREGANVEMADGTAEDARGHTGESHMLNDIRQLLRGLTQRIQLLATSLSHDAPLTSGKTYLPWQVWSHHIWPFGASKGNCRLAGLDKGS